MAPATAASKSRLTPCLLGPPEQLVAVLRNQRLVGRDHGFAGGQAALTSSRASSVPPIHSTSTSTSSATPRLHEVADAPAGRRRNPRGPAGRRCASATGRPARCATRLVARSQVDGAAADGAVSRRRCAVLMVAAADQCRCRRQRYAGPRIIAACAGPQALPAMRGPGMARLSSAASRPSSRNMRLMLRRACRVRCSFSIRPKRTWPSPYSPKPIPGDTATLASRSSFLLNSREPMVRLVGRGNPRPDKHGGLRRRDLPAGGIQSVAEHVAAARYMALISPTQLWSPSSAAMAATWIGVNMP
jgi:hypothetical protein